MKEIMTYKSEIFYFSDKYEEEKINNLLIRATILNETILDLPVLPALSSRLEPEIMYSSISGTAAIEGNPIDEAGVKKIAEGKEVDEYTKKDKQEIVNLIQAYGILSGIEKTESYLLSEDLVRKLHSCITKEVPDENNIPGQYRNGTVYVGDKAHGGVYSPPKTIDDIKFLMKEFIDWINSPEILEINPFIRAALAHYHFCIIHPFWDGNGRTARLIESIILQAANIKYVPKELSNFYYRNIDEYFNAFSKSIKIKREVTPFLEFTLKAAVSSLDKIKKSIVYFIRVSALRDYYAYQRQNKLITDRQFELLSLLLDYSVSFTIKDLFSMSPFTLLYKRVSTQTARRDLKKLTDLKLLSIDDEGRYFLNLRAFG